jgi:hypothetical protein
MSDTYINAELRREVVARAGRRCEYCLIHENDTFLGCHVDHVISEKHGGQTVSENLALACVFCNRHKGSDIASLDEERHLTSLFNPRNQNWAEHFQFDGVRIEGRTREGKATAKLLRFNDEMRLVERLMQSSVG